MLGFDGFQVPVLTHLLPKSKSPSRAVVLGAAGFVGAATVKALAASGVETLALSRAEVDLLAPGARGKLRNYLRSGDALVFTSARAPCKDAVMLVENVRMAEAVCAAVRGMELAHVVYVSSDAVYKDSPAPLTEESCAEPASPHGAMHLAREVLLRSEFLGPVGILRPTLIYGRADPHNGYGPNRFRRLASEGKEIGLFGNGEERRDHVSVDDVAGLLAAMVAHRSSGVLNAVSGEVTSFRDLAEFIAGQFEPMVAVNPTPRAAAMPHGGYRPFDASGIRRAFPEFRITPWREGIAALCRSRA
jgi:nucleoside-diphosphate-sugar epimerase